jgi:hypothetical protein
MNLSTLHVAVRKTVDGRRAESDELALTDRGAFRAFQRRLDRAGSVSQVPSVIGRSWWYGATSR